MFFNWAGSDTGVHGALAMLRLEFDPPPVHQFSRIVKWYNNRLITGHYKFDSCSGNQFLCRCGGVVQRNGLQNRKAVSSNLTTYSKLMLR